MLGDSEEGVIISAIIKTKNLKSWVDILWGESIPDGRKIKGKMYIVRMFFGCKIYVETGKVH